MTDLLERAEAAIVRLDWQDSGANMPSYELAEIVPSKLASLIRELIAQVKAGVV